MTEEKRRLHPALALCPTFRTLLSDNPSPAPSKPIPESHDDEKFQFCVPTVTTNGVSYPVFNRSVVLFRGGMDKPAMAAPFSPSEEEEVGEYGWRNPGGARKTKAGREAERRWGLRNLVTKERAAVMEMITNHRGPCGGLPHRQGHLPYRKVLLGLFGGDVKGHGRFTRMRD